MKKDKLGREPREINPSQLVGMSVTIALTEARNTGLITQAGFDYVAKRSDDVFAALASGKVMVPTPSGIYDIQTREELGIDEAGPLEIGG